MQATEKTQELAQNFMRVAKHASDLATGLNTSYGRFVGLGTFYAYSPSEAEQAAAALEELIAHREMEILQAQEALEEYRKAIAEGGQRAHQQMVNEAIEKQMRGDN